MTKTIIAVIASLAIVLGITGNALASLANPSLSDLKEEIREKILGEENTKDVKVGENFTIVLNANPTTGYQWSVQMDSEYLKLVQKSYRFDDEADPEKGGKESFEFNALKKGETNVKFYYKKQSEEPTEVVTYTIKIK